MSRNDPVDLELCLVADPPNAAAILVSNDDGDEVWLPRSQIEYDESASRGDFITVTLPEWLAIAKGLV